MAKFFKVVLILIIFLKIFIIHYSSSFRFQGIHDENSRERLTAIKELTMDNLFTGGTWNDNLSAQIVDKLIIESNMEMIKISQRKVINRLNSRLASQSRSKRDIKQQPIYCYGCSPEGK